MTATELQALTDQDFKLMAMDDDDNIMFAVPIPGVDAWQFDSQQEAAAFLWDDEEITAALDQWAKYVATLPNKKRTIFKFRTDSETKDRLMTCAKEQHKTASQLLTEWIWSHTVNADTERKKERVQRVK